MTHDRPDVPRGDLPAINILEDTLPGSGVTRRKGDTCRLDGVTGTRQRGLGAATLRTLYAVPRTGYTVETGPKLPSRRRPLRLA